MASRKLRWFTVGLFASASAGLLASTSVMNSAFAYGEPAITADAADPATALIMGPSGLPVPPPTYLDAVNDLYIHLPAGAIQPLTTPEGIYPLSGVKSLPTDTSIAHGVPTLNNAILQQIADGNHVDVFGYSQSSVISSMEMSQLANEGVNDNLPDIAPYRQDGIMRWPQRRHLDPRTPTSLDHWTIRARPLRRLAQPRPCRQRPSPPSSPPRAGSATSPQQRRCGQAKPATPTPVTKRPGRSDPPPVEVRSASPCAVQRVARCRARTPPAGSAPLAPYHSHPSSG